MPEQQTFDLLDEVQVRTCPGAMSGTYSILQIKAMSKTDNTVNSRHESLWDPSQKLNLMHRWDDSRSSRRTIASNIMGVDNIAECETDLTSKSLTHLHTAGAAICAA
jgi:hypothetical protein